METTIWWSTGVFSDFNLTGLCSQVAGQLYAKLASLAGYIGQSDSRPTDAQLEVLGVYRELLVGHEGTFNDLKDNDVAAFNRLLGEKGFGGIYLSRDE